MKSINSFLIIITSIIITTSLVGCKTQKTMIDNTVVKVSNTERNHILTLTTHSPYILYALNNCMMGGLVKGNIPADELDDFQNKSSCIDPGLVSVWEIEQGKGTIRPIKNKMRLIVSAFLMKAI